MLPINVHYNHESMANIVSMKDVLSLPNVKVTMDSSQERAVIVDFKGDIFKFTECANGLYFYDTAVNNKSKKDTTP